jgi:hypothetical protein
VIEFTIPGLRLQSLNARENWRVKAKRVKAERYNAGCHTRLAIIRACNVFRKPEFTTQSFPEPPMTITMTRIGPRLMDSDNAVGACKHVRDQIAEDLSVDDGDPRITWNVEQEKGPYAVRVRIEALESVAGE